MPLLAYPLALLGLAAIPAALAIYLLQNRFKRHTVSSIVLWQHLAVPKSGGVRVQHLRLPLLFFLEILALVLLALAAGDPRMPRPSSERLVVAVLDDSASMAAQGAHGSSHDRALKALAAELRRARASSLKCILAGVRPVVLDMPGPVPASLGSALEQWQCRAPADSLHSSVAMALELAGAHGQIVVVTDHAPPAPLDNERIRWIACGEPVNNIAIVEASRTPGVEVDRCFLAIANFGAEPARLPLAITHDDKVKESRQLGIAPGQTTRIIVPTAKTTEKFVASLPDDALGIDNSVCLLRPPTRRVKIEYALANKELDTAVRNAVEATGLASPLAAMPRLVVTDNPAAVSPPGAWIVRFTEPAKATPYVGPFAVDGDNPLVAGVGLDDVTWAAGTNSMPGTPVITAGSVMLMTERAMQGGCREINFNFSPEMSSVPRSPAWPVLFWNIMRCRGIEGPGPREANVRAGTDASVNLPPGVADVRIAAPGGTAVPVAARRSVVVFTPNLPGVYTVRAGDASYAVGSQFLSPAESDVRSRLSGEWGEGNAAVKMPLAFTSIAWMLAAAALLVLVFHLYAASRGGGGA